MRIIVDTREHGPRGLTSTRKSRAQEYYSAKGYDCEIKQLTYGDYLFNNQVVFEYKLIDDLMSSITNGRLFDECVNQTVTYPYSYLIVEGNLQDYILDTWESYIVRKQYMFDYNKFIKSTYSRYEGAIRRVQTICPVIYAASESVAFQEMLLQAQKCCESKHYGSEAKSLLKSASAVDSVLCSVKGVSSKKAKLIKETLKIKSLTDLIEATIEDFNKVKSIGEITANNLYEFIHKKED